MSAIPGRIDNRMVTADGFNDYHKKFLYALPRLGQNNTVTGQYSFGWGYNNNVTGQYSFGLGYNNTVTGDNSFVAGINLRAFNSQTIFGKNNEADASILFAIGNGASPETPANAFEIDRNTNIKFGSDHEVSGSYNFLMGNHLIAKGNQVIFGQYNQEDEKALFMIGAGEKDQKKNLFLIEKTGSFKTFNTNILIQNDIEIEQNQILDVKAVNADGIEYKTTNAIILGGKNNKIASSYGFICGLNNLINLSNTLSPIADRTSLQETPAFVLGKGLRILFDDATARTGPIFLTGQYNDIATNYSNAAFVIGGGSSEQDRKNLLAVGYNGELWLGNCFLSSSLKGLNGIELIRPSGEIRHALFSLPFISGQPGNDAIWGTTKIGYNNQPNDTLFINSIQPFEYLDTSFSDDYIAPTKIIFNRGTTDSYAILSVGKILVNADSSLPSIDSNEAGFQYINSFLGPGVSTPCLYANSVYMGSLAKKSVLLKSAKDYRDAGWTVGVTDLSSLFHNKNEYKNPYVFFRIGNHGFYFYPPRPAELSITQTYEFYFSGDIELSIEHINKGQVLANGVVASDTRWVVYSSQKGVQKSLRHLSIYEQD